MKPAINSSQVESRLYSQKDANAILEQAIGVHGKNFTDENLKEMAKELGVSPVELEGAKEVWFNQQQKLIELEKFKTKRWKMTMIALVLIFGMVIVTIMTIIGLIYFDPTGVMISLFLLLSFSFIFSFIFLT